MTEDDIIEFVRGLPDVVATTGSEANGAPEAAWGDSFFFYDPIGDAANQLFPFATLVTNDYPGFDEASELSRDGVFRLNIAIGRRAFEDQIGYPANRHPDHAAEFDYTNLDTLLPHPVYAVQGWVSVLCPSNKSTERAKALLTDAHRLAAKRYARRNQTDSAGE
jgi:hypothetical protein